MNVATEQLQEELQRLQKQNQELRSRFDIPALGLAPLALHDQGEWNPEDEYWGEPDDPINDHKDAGNHREAFRILMRLCETDLRCLDAHSHLGNWFFDRDPQQALRHYDVGGRIGELSLGQDFDRVLRWGMIDNRPFLRCLHGRGLCLWRLGFIEEAKRVFNRLLWLNPSDNQGIRFLMARIADGQPWTPDL